MASESDKWGWKHVSVYGGFDKSSGTKRWKCNHCNMRYNGSYSRVKAHLLGFTGVGVMGCPAIQNSLRSELRALEQELRVHRRQKKSVPSLAKEEVDEIVARFFYGDGLNVNIVDSPFFREMVRAISAFGPGYEPPSKEMLSDTFISKEKTKLEKAMALARESWRHTGCTIICVNSMDGSLGCLCINFFVSSSRGVLFLKSIDINEGDEGDNMFVSVLNDLIIESGPGNVVQIISHLGVASTTFELVMLSKFPQIFWSDSTSHSVKVLMEEMAELEWMKSVVSCARGVEQIVLNYQQSSSCGFYYESSTSTSTALSMRFAPSYCLVQNIYQMKEALRVLVVSNEWKQWKFNAPGDSVTVTVSTEATILGDEFWNRAQLMLHLCEPFVRRADTSNTDKWIMGDAYNWRVQSLADVRNTCIDDTALNQMELLLETRWTVLFSPLHATGYMLNPRYFGRGQSEDSTVMRGWKTTLDKYEPETESDLRRLLREQLGVYWRLEGSFGEEDAVECRDKMDPVGWWENFGFETPQLQSLAIRVLSQVSSVPFCRESGSLPCREKVKMMGVERLEDVVFVRNNLGLLSQRSGHVSCLPMPRAENS